MHQWELCPLFCGKSNLRHPLTVVPNVRAGDRGNAAPFLSQAKRLLATRRDGEVNRRIFHLTSPCYMRGRYETTARRH